MASLGESFLCPFTLAANERFEIVLVGVGAAIAIVAMAATMRRASIRFILNLVAC